ncbi:MAG: nitroreductase [Candidatus Omnitrophica bacterium]|nr:nitroreductase [Candidatus Omnitrophota bacterium]
MDLMPIIKKRRSVRRFKNKEICPELIENILQAGRWAPSGLNNQPWKFMVLEGENKDALCKFTHCQSIIKSAEKLIAVFLNKKTSYNYQKDLMAIGASIENMLLYIHCQGLGACWLGEILNQRKKVHKFLKLGSTLELEAVIALGYPLAKTKTSRRKPLKDLMIK